MRIFSGNGKRRVYWIPMPVPRSPRLAVDYHLMDLAVADAAAVVPGVTDVNIVDRLSKNGQYSDYLPGLNGQTILARTQDGIHLSTDGASLAATLVPAGDEQGLAPHALVPRWAALKRASIQQTGPPDLPGRFIPALDGLGGLQNLGRCALPGIGQSGEKSTECVTGEPDVRNSRTATQASAYETRYSPGASLHDPK